jgi:putative transposase
VSKPAREPDWTPAVRFDAVLTTAAMDEASRSAWCRAKGVYPQELEHSKPRVSNDNAFAESAFRTAKYRPEFARHGFKDLDQARDWASQFVHWYIVEHLQSGIRYVSPNQRHAGQNHEILAARHHLYLVAQAANPRRWTRNTRNWTPIGAVTLNPEKPELINTESSNQDKQAIAA